MENLNKRIELSKRAVEKILKSIDSLRDIAVGGPNCGGTVASIDIGNRITIDYIPPTHTRDSVRPGLANIVARVSFKGFVGITEEFEV